MTVIDNQYNENIVRVIALISAGVLLNFGLFFILSILTPLVVGFVGGFFFFRYRAGVFVSALSTAVAYTIIFIVTATVAIDILAISSAIAIMTGLGAFGGIAGVFVHLRTLQ
ncbi:MAG: hypothetical protein ACFFCT_00980 [Candidatus Odinarchaeota archaeon]